jgi:hypothetical protein
VLAARTAVENNATARYRPDILHNFMAPPMS